VVTPAHFTDNLDQFPEGDPACVANHTFWVWHSRPFANLSRDSRGKASQGAEPVWYTLPEWVPHYYAHPCY